MWSTCTLLAIYYENEHIVHIQFKIRETRRDNPEW
jgi:hypothetical protein